ncbi:MULTISPECIES: WXG100 family type VII secretion target [unclassified Crossiella]|uniref:WXG100 family type VII secretion target n=1 Tax=unclassified Crossiella TaxID=2620835 RepID=UPI001FFEBE4E|nr:MULTISPECIES: WXG100 family type VII secretion target [unclassified Crossiella]MCK2236898.1 WXG100 family type VII secretion target [Crossiella sp. S99.2]MCK2250566.1 WXG100 family type VII secretion target [Crossiella sp. S99.1]
MEINIDFGALQEGQSGCQRAAGNMQTKLDDLKSNLQPLISTWTGGAAEAYQVHQKAWDQSAVKLQEILAKIGIALGTATEAYQQNESKSAGSW